MRPQFAHLYYGGNGVYLTESLCGFDTVKCVKVLGSQWTGAAYSPSFSSSVLFPFTSCSFQNLFHLPSHAPPSFPSFLFSFCLLSFPCSLLSPPFPGFLFLLILSFSHWSHHRHRRSETSLDVWQGWWICKRLKHRNSTQSGKADRGVCCVITTSLSFSHSLG